MEDGMTDRLFANKIAENIYSQLDDKGREMIKFNEIIDHRKNEAAMTKENGFTQLSHGHKKCKPTTRGWQVLVKWNVETMT